MPQRSQVGFQRGASKFRSSAEPRHARSILFWHLHLFSSSRCQTVTAKNLHAKAKKLADVKPSSVRAAFIAGIHLPGACGDDRPSRGEGVLRVQSTQRWRYQVLGAPEGCGLEKKRVPLVGNGGLWTYTAVRS